MKIPAAFIFDLDGVIVETADFHFKAWKQLADELDIPFDEEQNQLLKGLSRSKSLEKLLALDDRKLPKQEFQQLMDRKNGWYQDYITGLTPDDILDGIPEFLEELQEMGARLAIGSSSKNAQTIMDYLQLGDMFEVVIDGTKITKSKPHPQVFLKGANALGVKPEECLVFEDAASGVEAANTAGMISVGVGDEKYLGDADLLISNFKGLTPGKLLEQLNNK